MRPQAPADPPDPRRIRHIRIEFGELRLDYPAGAEQARDVADHLAEHCPELLVTVDDELRDDLPPLPCAQLWEDTPSGLRPPSAKSQRTRLMSPGTQLQLPIQPDASAVAAHL
ncbi:hypothetical protein IU486_09810 [Streptomyces gardneri]|uniref:hypothetical protein n=1 Tax=Nocardia TaxID=1817 RepID=UPI001356D3A7|nr:MULTISPECIES: hypothetical protein [Nocardia]MBF6165067.1 hypothetical protein [Streptomyces gardneri]